MTTPVWGSWGVQIKKARDAMSRRAFCGFSAQHLGELIAELAPRWDARCESGRRQRRHGARRRKAGAGPKYELVFTDRALVTLVYLRTGLTHEALGVIYEVGSSTIGRAIGEIRPLLAARGFAVPDRPGIRLRTLDDVFAYGAAENITLRIDGTETPVRRPKAHSPGRRAFVSGKRKQNTIKTTTISDHQGRTLWSGAVRPGRMHDQTAVRTEGIAERFRMHQAVKAEVDDGPRSGQRVSRPGQRTPEEAEGHRQRALTQGYEWRELRRRQSSRRICVEHANAELRQWHPLRRYTGRRESHDETHLAIAALFSDRAARRATQHKPSTALVLIRPTAC
ncbi:transposase family protein [Streptomyces thinghirensis]|uniref:Transposase family protein n=1 Tax=Streptomyces thinghirensis TaxID=551547 RepID=A0ABP9T1A5_9ACTN